MHSRHLVQILIAFLFLLASTSFAEEQALHQSVKKQLFVFPVEFDRNASQLDRKQRRYFENALMRELVYNFPRFAFYEMPAGSNIDDFLANANEYLLEHAQEIKQKRVDTGGRYGEAPITLDDLQQIVENGYAFVPRMTEGKLEKNSWVLEAEIKMYRTHDQSYLGKVSGSTKGLGGLMALNVLDVLESIDKDHREGKAPDVGELTDLYHRKVTGVVSELRTNLRKADEFAIYAIVTKVEANKFTFNQGLDLGVELDKRYKVWSTSDPNAEGRVLLAYGKVRKIEQNESEVQLLIGGRDLSYADQVVEDARFGINISPVIGVLPISRSGFEAFMDGRADIPGEANSGDAEFPEEGRNTELYLGVGIETNTASWSNLSEFYLTAEGGMIGGVPHTFIFHVNAGITKKYWFHRFAWTWSARYGALLITLTDLDSEEVDGDQINEAVV
ncbi:MAG TPA: hypothetical protein ENH10_09690, partial [Bacteroidetes bacterium]|nr:hypothetical protein [Bacteroidota bacterium]HEX05405.1 hypothetical protein [Bacteroidota bacterium]